MVRFAAKLSKGKYVKFISHLDFMRCLQRAIRRAGIPVSYSKGFNPHTEMSFATPLAVGTASEAEYMEFWLDKDMDVSEIAKALNDSLPEGIRVIMVKKVDDKFPSLMSIVCAASYEITVSNIGNEQAPDKSIESFINRPSIEVIKKGKSGERVVDIKPMILSIKLKEIFDNRAVIEATTAAGSRSNLSPELLFTAMKKYIAFLQFSELADITKKETYIEWLGNFKTPMEIL